MSFLLENRKSVLSNLNNFFFLSSAPNPKLFPLFVWWNFYFTKSSGVGEIGSLYGERGFVLW